jgi:hypothetical protein
MTAVDETKDVASLGLSGRWKKTWKNTLHADYALEEGGARPANVIDETVLTVSGMTPWAFLARFGGAYMRASGNNVRERIIPRFRGNRRQKFV